MIRNIDTIWAITTCRKFYFSRFYIIIPIGKPILQHYLLRVAFPPVHTVRETFTSYGAPSNNQIA
ncbi:MAG TPA: hypothetical protein DEU03_09240 [Bacillus sp. (in: Bacteria)]|nr:hypothetical protein EGX95_00915 [Bacillus sp. FDAARGOS_527]MDR4160552.1 hypothetical protein [Bacillus paranthracis]MDR4262062.1 hypothetical protein [Bacillus pacificus]RSC66361.1 hypothetical protein EGS86_00705 [Bacillus sp. (in: firmicutes)]TSI07312.1 hypothetical protein FOT98_26260 [Bacillus sp. HY001]